MVSNFLEQLVAEWFAYNGYFVRTNVRFGKRGRGGYEGEIDVAAFDPVKTVLVHVETSMSAESWQRIDAQLRKKFHAARGYYEKLFHLKFKEVQRIAVAGYARARPTREKLDKEISITSIPKLVQQIVDEIRRHDPLRDVVPEQYPLLRAIQYAVHWGNPRESLRALVPSIATTS